MERGTLRYSPELGAIDDAPLLALGRGHEILSIREHFFVTHELPHLLCIVSYQRRAGALPVAVPPSQTAPSIPPEPKPKPKRSDSPEPPADLPEDQRRLYDAIRTWRIAEAERAGVPRYVVLTNRDVEALVRRMPDSIAALRRVPGFGKAKVGRYGEALLELLRPTPTPRLVEPPPRTEEPAQP